ncbi:MAG: metalloregulator ArsR/SmtB family transcription factor [bacterium]
MKLRCCKNKKTFVEISQVAEFLKVINEENRLKILCLLKAGEKCVCEIWQDLNLAQNLASHHLKVLKDFGLISSRQEGLKVIYSIDKKQAKSHLKLINKLLNG